MDRSRVLPLQPRRRYLPRSAAAIPLADRWRLWHNVGHSISAIATQLDLDRSTVRRFTRGTSLDELLVKVTNRTSVLDGHTDHLTARYAAGVTDAAILHTELKQRGFTGSVQTIRRYLHPLRGTTSRSTSPAARPVPRPAVPKPCLITHWIMTDPDHLDPDDQAAFATVQAACPDLAALTGHVHAFADMMNNAPVPARPLR